MTTRPSPLSSTLDPRVAAFLEERGSPPAVPLSGDASTRRYFRVRGPEGDRVLALHPEPFDVADLPFAQVQALLAGWEIPVPEILDHDGARGILLLNDLGDQTLQERLKEAGPGERASLYSLAVADLVRLQSAAAASQAKAACFDVAFDAEKLAWELGYFLKNFLEGHRGCRLEPDDREALLGLFHRLAVEIASWPRVLCHRDYHSRNLMWHRERLYWIDFQDARMGPATYDLASLLRDSYVDLDEDLVSEQVESFRRQVAPGEPAESFLRRFELMCVQRNLKALGTFGYMDVVRGNPIYLQYIPRTLAHVRRNLLRHPELHPLRRGLARHLPELQ